MNCECVYTIKGGQESDFDDFAQRRLKGLRNAGYELYPVTYAVVTKDVRATKDYDGWGRAYILKAGTHIMFVEGKYCCMTDYGNAKVLFPRDRNTNWFKDLKEYE